MKRWQLGVSFRGVPFFVDNTDDEFARRGAHHQYPQRDKGTFEDLGKDDPVYNLHGYVTELSPGGYAAARDKLIAACTAGGLGDLVHPYYGTKKVQCTSCRVTHSDKENGVARFALSFLEADEPAAPVEVDNSAAKVNDAADAAQEAALGDFAQNWNLAGVPSFVYDAATGIVQSVSGSLTGLAGPLPGILGDTGKFVSGTARLLGVAREALDNPMAFFMRQANSLTGGAASASGLLSDGLALGRQISGLGRMLSLLSGNEKDAYKTQQSFRTTGQSWPSVPTYTENRRIQAGNQAALQALVERTAVIDSARMAPYMPLESRDEAVAVRDALTEQIDALAEKAPDMLYKRLENLRAAVVADITKRGPELGRIGSYTPKVTRPALVLAYELYQDIGKDADRATELAARNGVNHPGFVPGGQTLEVRLNA
jgi:prophage DNA circulation protein